MRYYRMKLEAERVVASSDLPHTILRATQFHAFVAWLISKAARVPLVLPLPSGFKFQTADEAEVAARLVRWLGEGARAGVWQISAGRKCCLSKRWRRSGWRQKSIIKKPQE